MISNSKMTAGRFLRWYIARKKLAWIKAHLEAGRTVQVSTVTRATRFKHKHIDMLKASKTGLYMQSGKTWVCIDFTDICAY
jgi:hypothetical protein